MDQEGDIISITNQGDLDEARCEPTLKLVIARNVEDARSSLAGVSNSMLGRSELLNQSMNSVNYGGNGQLGGIGQAYHAERERYLAAQARFGVQNEMYRNLAGGQQDFGFNTQRFTMENPMGHQSLISGQSQIERKSSLNGAISDRIFGQNVEMDLFKPESHSIACGGENVVYET
jgi:hypothetical protein